MRLQRHELAVSAPIADKATTPTPLLLVVRSHGYRAERSRRPAAGPGLVSSKGPPMLGDDAREAGRGPCPPKVRARAEGPPATPPPAAAHWATADAALPAALDFRAAKGSCRRHGSALPLAATPLPVDPH